MSPSYIIPKRKDDLMADVLTGVPTFNFGAALEYLKSGQKVARNGWNGKGIFIGLQEPDENSANTLPYIYMDTRFLESNNPAAAKGRVPWLASQTDMLADDWFVIEEDQIKVKET